MNDDANQLVKSWPAAIKQRPGAGDGNRVPDELMHAEQEGFRSNFHLEF
jgi:hypothetical protein